MTEMSEPSIRKSCENFTKITFSPDLVRFNLKKLDKDTIDLMSRRAYDVAASTKGVTVFLNRKKIPVKHCSHFM